MKQPFICLLIALFFLACTQPEGEIILVPDNTAPPDLSVSEVIKENYVNKLFISLLGRKATGLELSGALALLDQDNAAIQDRKTLVADILAQSAYAQRSFDIARVEILNNLDTAEISQNIFVYQQLIEDPQYADFIDLLMYEIDRMVALRSVPQQLEIGTISRIDMHKRFIDNLFYDEINMGTQNFVLAMFEYFLGRYPTDAEEERAILMVDGFNAVLFGEEGNSKADFIQLFFASDDYLEGQVIDVYQDFLFRLPSSQEMSIATVSYAETQDYHELLIDILTTDEYLGI